MAASSAKGKQSFVDRSGLPRRDLAPRVAEIRIRERTGRHTHEGGDHVLAKTDSSHSEGVVHKIEREQRNQPDERKKPPALLLHPLHERGQSFARARGNPIGGDISRDHEGERGAQGRAGKVAQRSRYGTEQSAARQSE